MTTLKVNLTSAFGTAFLVCGGLMLGSGSLWGLASLVIGAFVSAGAVSLARMEQP